MAAAAAHQPSSGSGGESYVESTSGAGAGDYLRGPTLSEAMGDVEYLKHWASPAELLEMQTQWHAVVQRTNQDILELKRRLQVVSEERDALFREVRQTEKLAALYGASRVEFDKMKQERANWMQEKALLAVEFQRALNELARLRGTAAIRTTVAAESGSGSSTSGESHGPPHVGVRGASVGTTTTTTSGRGAATRGSSMSGAAQNDMETSHTTVDGNEERRYDGEPAATVAGESGSHSATSDELWLKRALRKVTHEEQQLEIVRLHEELRRLECLSIEERNRFHLDRIVAQSNIQTLQLQLSKARMREQLLEQRCSGLQQEVASTTGNHAQRSTSLQVQLDAVMNENRQLRMRTEQLEESLKEERATAARSQADHAKAMADVEARGIAQLTKTRAERDEIERKLLATIQHLQTAATQKEDARTEELKSLQQELQEKHHSASAQIAQLDDARRLAVQQLQLVQAQSNTAQHDVSRLLAEKESLQRKLDAASNDAVLFRHEVSRGNSEVARLSTALHALQVENHQFLKSHHELERARQAILALENELVAVKQSTEQHLSVMSTALDLQRAEAEQKASLMRDQRDAYIKELSKTTAKYRYVKQLLLAVDDDGSLRRALRDMDNKTLWKKAQPKNASSSRGTQDQRTQRPSKSDDEDDHQAHERSTSVGTKGFEGTTLAAEVHAESERSDALSIARAAQAAAEHFSLSVGTP